MAYAKADALARRWRALTPEEYDTATILLEDAQVMLDSAGYANAEEDILAIVSCNMVRRAMTTSGDAFGIDGQTAPSMGWGSSLPADGMYLTGQERNMLRGGARIGSVQMEYLNEQYDC